MVKNLIIFSGKLQSGKDTAVSYLSNLAKIENKSIEHISFAIPLKDMCRDKFSPLIEYLNEIATKYGISELITNDLNWYETKNPITRRILQIVGFDIIKSIDNNYLIRMAKERCIQSTSDVIFISDARDPEEIETFKNIPNIQTTCIRIIRTGNNQTDATTSHISETAMDNYDKWDYIVHNNTDLGSFHNICEGIYRKIINNIHEN